jgi:hypothetical protein
MQFSEGACKRSLRVPRAKFDASLNLPTLKSVTDSGADLAQAVSDGDMARADVLAGKLASNAAKMKDVRDNLLKQLNDKLKAKGKKPLQLDKEINKRISQLESGVNKNLASKGFGPMASLGKSNIGGQLPIDSSLFNPKNVGEKGAIVIDSNPSDSSSSEPINEGGAEVEKETTLSETLEGFEAVEEDISKRSEDSIFNQLSTRYLLNYHRFFEKKKEEDPVVKP